MTDSAAWIGLAVATAFLALAASLVLLLVVLRRNRGGPDGAARELEQARGESRRAQRLAEIAATIDLDTVLQRTLAAAAQSAGVDAGMMVVSQEGDEPLVATRGLTAEEAARQPVSLAPPGGARALSIGYRYDAREERARDRGGEPIRGGVAVPVRGEDGVLGTLAVFWRGEAAGAADEEVARLEELAASCAPAIRNAQRFRTARRLTSLDPLTGLGSRRAFHEALARECARAQRYERRLTVVLLDIDDFTATNARIGPAAGDAVLAGVAARLREAVRASDLACRVGGDEFALILPESSERDAEQLYRRIQFAVAPDAGELAPHVRLSAGIAELDHADDPVSLLERADEALRRATEAGKGKMRRAELGS